jgi:hypothetical protein
LIDGHRLFHRCMQKLLSIADILISGAVKALFNRNKASEPRRITKKRNPACVTSEWDYRPKGAIRRFAAGQSAGTENADLLTPSVAEDKSDKASFDDRWLEFGTHTFVNMDGVDPMAANEPMKPSLSDHERAFVAYD